MLPRWEEQEEQSLEGCKGYLGTSEMTIKMTIKFLNKHPLCTWLSAGVSEILSEGSTTVWAKRSSGRN